MFSSKMADRNLRLNFKPHCFDSWILMVWLNRLEKYFDRFVATGEADSPQENRNNRFTAMVFLQCGFVGLIMGLAYVWSGTLFLASLMGLFVLNCLLCFYLLRFKKLQKFSRVFFIMSANGVIFLFSYLVGHKAEFHQFYIPSIALPFLMFPKEQKRILAMSIILPLLLMTLEFVTPFQNGISQNLEDQQLYLLAFMSSFLSASMVAFSFFYIFRIALQNEDRILTQNEALITSEKMSTLGIVAAGIAHEINNPLTIILGSTIASQRFLEKTAGIDPRVLKQLETIRNTTSRIAKIVDGLKVFSRDSRLDQTQPISLKEILEQARTLCHQKLKDIPLRIFCEASIMARANPTELLQVLVNLVNNAIDAQQGKSERWIEIRVVDKSDYFAIQVIDSGAGIDGTVLRKMFTPFFTTKPVGQGTGLGLSISKRLMENRGGKLYYALVQSHTAFVVEVPSLANEQILAKTA